MLGIVAGSKVDFHRAADGSVVLVRADKERPASRFGKLRGHAGKGLDTDATMALTRGVTLIDTDVLLDLVTDDPEWTGRGSRSRDGANAEGRPVSCRYILTQYRKAGGSHTGVLPNFFIDAHAAVQQLPHLTQDVGRYRTYFPSLKLISPDL
ncbi:UNVERIFIED_ORG: hypothetical protein GGD51_004200 [Rhizobium esperanzae]